ncbi:MAG: hypothetical protein AABY07_06210, partial [Nanoarchaeota archaeon]
LISCAKTPFNSFSLRRFMSDVKIANEMKLIDEVPSERAGVNLDLRENRWLNLIKISCKN